jgi:MFS family permease
MSGVSPLRQRTFAVLWAATVVGNIGSFMRDVASAWTATELSAGPAAVALIQAAAALPIFLFALPAGVLADLLDRRRFLLLIQVGLAAVSITLAVLSHTGQLTLPWLVGLTFLGGLGAALIGPTWQALVPELVERSQLKQAVALNSLGVNIARAIGPALGGLALAAFGAAFTYGADALSYLVVMVALFTWHRPSIPPDPLHEQFSGALKGGLRFARYSRELHAVLLRAALFFCLASGMWALLPLVARQTPGGGAALYGVLLASVGVGAIAGAMVLPRLQRTMRPSTCIAAAAAVLAVSSGGLAYGLTALGAMVAMAAAGVGWIVALTTLNGLTQAILPNWVRGRGLAVYLVVFNGAMALGSLLWGGLAQQTSVSTSLIAGAIVLALFSLGSFLKELPRGENDLTSANFWPAPAYQSDAGDSGPVLVLIDYQIDLEDKQDFLAALKAFSRIRLQSGAYAWGATFDPEQQHLVVEWFLVESWSEHLRQHRRFSVAEAASQKALWKWHRGAEAPRVRHLVAAVGM